LAVVVRKKSRLYLACDKSQQARLLGHCPRICSWQSALKKEKWRVGGVPKIRIRNVNDAPVRENSEYVLYWMIANRRLHFNFALDCALERCADLNKPLVILEALRIGYPWASDRLHRFVIDGMADNARTCEARGIRYYPYVEPRPDADKGLLLALAQNACAVVTDEFPCFFLPRMVASTGKRLPVRLEAVDSNGMLPIYSCGQAAIRVYDFRRYLQRELPKHLAEFPSADPLGRRKLPPAPALPSKILKRWPVASQTLLSGDPAQVKSLPIDHSVRPAELRGGHTNARAKLLEFLDRKLPLYGAKRNEPELDLTSGLSPFLHFGHISVQEVFAELALREKWKSEKLSLRVNGSREGWWNMSVNAEDFLDQIITWRELGYNFSSHREDYDKYESLPDWVKKTLGAHAKDEREHLYSLEEFESAGTHDPLWNAAQMQLVREGTIHNYLRMLWGKKILQWTRSPREAAEIMIHLNNKYGLDGRDPNSYSGIFWVLGRYDRPWAPVRPVFGSIRYMSSDNTARKVAVKNYIGKYGPDVTEQRKLEI
jgi:deoxyribodipyrimidine photo-lyase